MAFYIQHIHVPPKSSFLLLKMFENDDVEWILIYIPPKIFLKRALIILLLFLFLKGVHVQHGLDAGKIIFSLSLKAIL